MATNFPASLDSLTNPTASDKLNSVTVPHATQHATLNDAVEALEAKVGVNGSAVTTSHDYLIDKQSVVPYDDASARTTAVPSPIEGQMSYLKDTNSVEVYDGSAWTAVGGGVANANFTDTETGTFTEGGIDYKYLIFTSSGTVTFDTDGLADFLVVAGGGGGNASRTAGNASAGGGAGGCLEHLGYYITAGTYTVTVGAGGTGSNNAPWSANGSTSSVGTALQATGGGGAGCRTSPTSADLMANGWGGGSGGGAGGGGTDSDTNWPKGGRGVAGQGNDGGTNAAGGGGDICGGGGGWGAAGGPTGVSQPANGGAGDTSTIITASIATTNSVGEVSGTDVYYGGGGAGNAAVGTYDGTGGIGGGGDLATAGTANTGGGGGASTTQNVAGGNGGSGVVIVRVAV